MADGKDCKCAAYGECECACGADWTPQEVYDLRAENARLKAELILKESERRTYMTKWGHAIGEVDRLKEELSDARRHYEELRKLIDGGSESMTHEGALRELADMIEENKRLEEELSESKADYKAQVLECQRLNKELQSLRQQQSETVIYSEAISKTLWGEGDVSKQSESERDAARLDWIADKCLTRPHGLWQWTFFGNTPHIRDAIDQAMQEGKK